MKHALETLESRRLMAVFTVTNANDTGVGSLRAAMTSANTTTTADVINFNIPGTGAKVIALASDLPAVVARLTIDGTTQPGYAGTPLIQIRGVGRSQNLNLDHPESAGSVVRGLSLTAASAGIRVNASNVTIERCHIGLDPNGAADSNSQGVLTTASANALQLKSNVISGNAGNGVQLLGDNAYIVGNIIGLDPTGTIARGNVSDGIRIIGGDSATIGDSGDANRNYFAANVRGIYYDGAANSGLIVNNYFGLDKTGNVRIANASMGIAAKGVSNTYFGVAGLGNRFSSAAIELFNGSNSNTITDNVMGIGVNPAINLGAQIAITLSDSSFNEVTNNVIGYAFAGVDINNGTSNQILDNHIGITPDGRNVGGNSGLFISSSGNTVVGNRIANNSSYGVYLPGGHNNFFDNATWSNAQQSYYFEPGVNDALYPPTVSSVSENANGTYTAHVAYSGFLPSGNYRVKLYESDTAGNATSGHTQRLLLTTNYIANGTAQTRSYTLSGMGLDKKFLTAAITELDVNLQARSTSLPSAAVQINGSPGLKNGAFEREVGHVIRMQFTSVFGSSISASDLVIRDKQTLQTYSANSVSNNSDGYRWTRNTPLPDGRYEAIIPVGAVSNANGSNRLPLSINFDVFAGDANADGTVNFEDLLRVAQNYGSTGKTFSQGNFDYSSDGKVDFGDLLIVAQRYGTSLFSAQPIAAETTRKDRPAIELLS